MLILFESTLTNIVTLIMVSKILRYHVRPV